MVIVSIVFILTTSGTNLDYDSEKLKESSDVFIFSTETIMEKRYFELRRGLILHLCNQLPCRESFWNKSKLGNTNKKRDV